VQGSIVKYVEINKILKDLHLVIEKATLIAFWQK